MSSAKSNLVDLLLYRHVETKAAILVSDDGEQASAVWLPLSQCEVEPKPSVDGDLVEVTCPEWLARDKGLI